MRENFPLPDHGLSGFWATRPMNSVRLATIKLNGGR